VVPWAGAKDHAELYDHMVGDSTHFYERIDYRCPEAIETTGLPDDSFDIIYSHACLEHVIDPAKAVASIGRLLNGSRRNRETSALQAVAVAGPDRPSRLRLTFWSHWPSHRPLHFG
jgi:SAM-dependent methyltransferase